jgi:hypothetical protein
MTMHEIKTANTLAGVVAAVLLASCVVAGAQTSCQSTIMNPCPPPQQRPDNAANSAKSADSNKSDQSQRGSPRGIPVAPDTSIGLGTHGIGLNGKF